jgi:hypothetical protein
MNRCFSVALMIATLAACDKKEEPSAAEPAKPSVAAETPTAPSAVAAAPAVVVDVDTLPVEEDFEADAEKDLTVANMTAKLDELEKEISAP